MTDHPAAWSMDRLLAECTSRRQRRSGPGGQHRNKVETAVVVTHVPSGIRGEATERRSQARNRQMAIFRLRVNLALRQRVVHDLAIERPSTLWTTRCHGGKISVCSTHEDFPSLLAEALDALAAAHWDVPTAARWLHCSSSQLIRFLKQEPQALVQVNEARRNIGLHPLK